MKICIEGTSGGYESLFSSGFSFYDVRTSTPHINTLGQTAYMIALRSESYIYAKYKIVRDVKGDKRTGLIVYFIVFSKVEKIPGEKIISLFDEIDKYLDKHIKNNNLNIENEDWEVIKKLEQDYNGFIQNNHKFPIVKEYDQFAYLYYNTDELARYFDQIYQPEFLSYSGVYLVDESYKSANNNPLLSLRHDAQADITLKVNLEQKVYSFTDIPNSHGINCTIKNFGNNKILAPGDSITNKDYLTFIIRKHGYQNVELEGFIDSPQLNNIIELDDTNKLVKIKADIDWQPCRQTVRVKCFDVVSGVWKDTPVKYTSSKQIQKLPKEPNVFEFVGQELNETWVFEVPENKYFDKSSTSWSNGDGDSVKIELQPKKKIQFNIIDKKTKKPVNGCEIFVNDQLINGFDHYVSKNKILSTVKLEVRKKNYTTKIVTFRLNDNPEIELTPYADIETPPILKVLLIFMVMVVVCLVSFLLVPNLPEKILEFFNPVNTGNSNSGSGQPITFASDDSTNSVDTAISTASTQARNAGGGGQMNNTQTVDSVSQVNTPTTSRAETTAVTPGNRSNQSPKNKCKEDYNKGLKNIIKKEPAVKEEYISLKSGFETCAICTDKLAEIVEQDSMWNEFKVKGENEKYSLLECK
jgi:hypothetical protein